MADGSDAEDLFDRQTLTMVGAVLGFLVLATLVFLTVGLLRGTTAPSGDAPTEEAAATALTAVAFQPPDEADIPDGPYGDAVKRGKAIFMDPAKYAADHVGSSLTCQNCHLDAGRTADAAPMWAAWVKYPAYRSKNDRINTMEDRIMGCFIYSMNAQASSSGVPPPAGDDIYRDLEAYFSWLATGAPFGADLEGRGFRKLSEPADGFDLAHGKQVFGEQCAACHGAQGQGTKNPDGSYLYPPLWGDHSYNWGAGMGKIANAAGFIQANMPFGNGNTLSDKDAWDVAAFVDSHERPRDPRQTGSIEEARAKHHKSGDYYGQTVNGDLLGDGVS